MTAPGGEFLRITMTLEGETLVDRLLAGIESRARDLTPAWPAVIAEFRAIVGQAFSTEGGSTDAGAWKALSPRTQRDRKRQGYGPEHPILQRSGRLFRALAQGEGAYERMGPRSLQIQLSSEVDYFKYHQSNQPRRRLPRRAMVSLTADQRHRLIRPLVNHITGRV